MKQYFKDLTPAFILSFVTSFMFFVFEPIILYSSNINDFWFDFNILLKQCLKMFLLIFLTLFFLCLIVYFINKYLIKKIKLYNICLIIGYILFIIFYLHGNYLAGWLPSLDGSVIDWSKTTTITYISSFISIIIIGIYIFLIKKINLDKVIKYSNYLICAIFIMISASLITTLLTTENIFKSKVTSVATTKNLNTYSNNKNFIILVVDAIDSKMFYQELNEKYEDLFDDFTYYPDTLAAYPFTRDSIPFIISGIWNENKTNFDTYLKKSYKESKLLDSLKEKSYELNNYDNEIILNDFTIPEFSNYKLLERDAHYLSFLKQILKYDSYKYFPYIIKKYTRINTMDFSITRKVEKEVDIFKWENPFFYEKLNNNIEKIDKNQFKFIHIEGGHVPFDLDENLNKIEDGTYKQKVDASLTTISKYIKTLKDNNIYNNSVLIIMADHGYNYETGELAGRQNPILLIKGINENHNMIKSDLPISFTDLNDAYQDLLNDKSSEHLFKSIDKNRSRRYLSYNYTEEDLMIEYIQTGKAWDNETMEKTGSYYKR